MYYKKFKVLLMVVVILIAMPLGANANDYTLNDLIENGKKLDGKEVIVSGEAIGEPLNRGKNTWININDTTNAIGIYMLKDDSDKIVVFGKYNSCGDKLKVKGIFNRACEEHGGDMDIHSSQVSILEEGKIKNEKISRNKIILAIVLSILTLIIGFILLKITIKKNK